MSRAPPATAIADSTPAQPVDIAEAATEVLKARLVKYMDKQLDPATQAALIEVREEGVRWKSILEGLGLTIQGVAEDTTTIHGVSLISTLRNLIDRVEQLERRLEHLTQAGDTPPTDLPEPPNLTLPQINVNAKGILQERCIINDLAVPTYNIVQTSGTPDSPVFSSACRIPERQLTVTGMGRTIRASHQAAAFTMLHRLDWPVVFPSSQEREVFRFRRERAEEMES